jgi:hypothetical protein
MPPFAQQKIAPPPLFLSKEPGTEVVNTGGGKNFPYVLWQGLEPLL